MPSVSLLNFCLLTPLASLRLRHPNQEAACWQEGGKEAGKEGGVQTLTGVLATAHSHQPADNSRVPWAQTGLSTAPGGAGASGAVSHLDRQRG